MKNNTFAAILLYACVGMSSGCGGHDHAAGSENHSEEGGAHSHDRRQVAVQGLPRLPRRRRQLNMASVSTSRTTWVATSISKILPAVTMRS